MSKATKRHSEETKQLLETGSDMTELQKLAEGVFKITVINTIWALMEKVDSMQ